MGRDFNLMSDESRDANGFIILRRKTKRGRPQYPKEVTPEPIGAYIGDFPLEQMECDSFTYSSTVCLIDNGRQYTTVQPVNSWQYKTWKEVSRTIDEQQLSSHFSKGSTRLRHVSAIAIYATVTGCDGKKKIVRLDSLGGGKGYKYCIARTKSQIEALLNRCSKMLTVDRSDYRTKAIKAKCDRYVYKAKIFVLYDDYSYDAFCNNIGRLFELLKLDITKEGEVIYER